MRRPRKHSVPVEHTRRYLEPGPVVLLSTAHRGERGIMTLGWHMMLGYDLVGTYLWQANRSHALAKRSRECVINLPTDALLDTVVGIGNCSGREGDKFERFGLTAHAATDVGGAVDRRVPCQLRVPAARDADQRRLPAVRVARDPRPRRAAASVAADCALSRRWPLHDRRPDALTARAVPAGHARQLIPP